MEWIAIRSVYHFGMTSQGKNVFEERVVCFEAEDFEAAHEKAEKEAVGYAKENDFTVHDEQVGYMQDGQPLIDGYEVWSELFETELSLDDFYKDRYTQYVYHRENA